MTCHQYVIRQNLLEEDLKEITFNHTLLTPKNFDLKKEEFSIEIKNFIKKYEWLGSVGVFPKWIFTARFEEKLGGVVLINEPTGYSNLLGKNTKGYEALIQRGACASWTPKGLGSKLIMFSCNWMVKNTEKRFFVAYSDSEAGEIGTIYQACNFEYLGKTFGETKRYIHPIFKKGKEFSSQSLKRTSVFKKWLKSNNLMNKEYFKENGFKDISKVPQNLMKSFYLWGNKIIKESKIVKHESKGKYILVLGKDRREQKFLNSLKNYKSLPYPKRIPKLIP